MENKKVYTPKEIAAFVELYSDLTKKVILLGSTPINSRLQCLEQMSSVDLALQMYDEIIPKNIRVHLDNDKDNLVAYYKKTQNRLK